MGEKVFISGRAVGESIGPLCCPWHVTGPFADSGQCFECAYGGLPILAIFSREVDAGLASLVKTVGHFVKAHQDEKVGAFLMLMTKEEGAPAILRELKAETGAGFDFCVPNPSAGDEELTRAYRLDPHVRHHIVASKEWRTWAKFSLQGIDEECIAAIRHAAEKMLAIEVTSAPHAEKDFLAFTPRHVTGPWAWEDSRACFSWVYDGFTIAIFSREVDAGLTSLVKAVDEVVRPWHQGELNTHALDAFFVLVSDVPDAESKVKELAAKAEARFALCVAGTSTGYDKVTLNYKLNPQVRHTVLVSSQNRVQANFALQRIEQKDIAAVLRAAEKMLAGK